MEGKKRKGGNREKKRGKKTIGTERNRRKKLELETYRREQLLSPPLL